jgi:diadenosine tetraphosphate (Ap4A) HIT family hydrolase
MPLSDRDTGIHGVGDMTCIFCTMQKDRIVLETDLAYAIFDAYPVNPGHMLVIPKRHVPSYFEATIQEKMEIIILIDEAKRIIDERFHPDGYNIGINIGRVAGQTVMHLHVHVIPRYTGDVPDPRGGVRGVIPKNREY